MRVWLFITLCPHNSRTLYLTLLTPLFNLLKPTFWKKCTFWPYFLNISGYKRVVEKPLVYLERGG